MAAIWDTKQVLRDISTEPESIRVNKAIADKTGQPTLEERTHLGQMVKASMDRQRSSYRERLINSLMPEAVDMQSNALVSDEMVMNVAFLVEKANLEKFESCVQQLDDLFHNQINFRIIGPLPPYSFATVEVTRANPKKMEEARQLLHLGKTFSEPEVRKAYRHLAAESHPDYWVGNKLAKTQFARLHQASALLIACCQGQVESGGNLLVNIRRLRDEEFSTLASLKLGGSWSHQWLNQGNTSIASFPAVRIAPSTRMPSETGVVHTVCHR